MFCRQNLLGILQRDLQILNLYDIQQTIVGNEEVEPSVIERIVTPGLHNITSFSWHPTDENRFLAISLTGLKIFVNIQFDNNRYSSSAVQFESLDKSLMKFYCI